MGKLILILIFLGCILFFPGTVFAQVVSSNILIEQSKAYDGKEVEFQGEVIGEIMKRGDFAWINLLDNFNAVGIWVRRANLNLINFAGDYQHKGDIILVKGIFHRACPQHGGDLDIHASSISKLESGYATPHRLGKEKTNLAVSLSFLLLALASLLLIRQRRNKKHGSF